MHAPLLSDTLLSDIIYSILNALAALGLGILNLQVGSHALYWWLIIAAATLITTLITIKTLWHFKERLYKGSDGKYHILPRALWRHKIELLCNEEIRLKLGNPNKHIKERKPNQKNHGWVWRWLTPYARVFHSAKHDWTATVERNKHFDIYGYIIGNRRAPGIAKKIRIEPASLTAALTEILTPEELKQAKTTHYKVSIYIAHADRRDFEKLEGRVKTTLTGVRTIELLPEKNAQFVEWQISETEPLDLLKKVKLDGQWLRNHQAQTPYKLPLGITENGDVWSLPIHMTLLIGQTGTGKGSLINGVIAQEAMFIEQGLVHLWGIDQKSSELRAYRDTPLFKEISLADTTKAIMILNRLLNILKDRATKAKNDYVNKNLNRNHKASKSNPLIILIIDELFSFMLDLKNCGQEGKKAEKVLNQILAQGRSLGIMVIAASQDGSIENLGAARQNFANKLMLRHESRHLAEVFLGKEAYDNGARPNDIEPSNQANNYATAGIGYALNETGQVEKIRFAYQSDDDICNLVLEMTANRPTTPKAISNLPTRPTPGRSAVAHAANQAARPTTATTNQITATERLTVRKTTKP